MTDEQRYLVFLLQSEDTSFYPLFKELFRKLDDKFLNALIPLLHETTMGRNWASTPMTCIVDIIENAELTDENMKLLIEKASSIWFIKSIFNSKHQQMRYRKVSYYLSGSLP